jgi:hypothetical protein
MMSLAERNGKFKSNGSPRSAREPSTQFKDREGGKKRSEVRFLFLSFANSAPLRLCVKTESTETILRVDF